MRRGHGGYVQMNDNTMSHTQIFLRTLPYLCPEGLCMKLRVIFAFIFLGISKTCDLAAPIATREVVNRLGGDSDTSNFNQIFLWICIYIGIVLGSKVASEFSNIVWANVSALQERDIALNTFKHLQALSLDWHLNRHTGKVMRIVSRGSSSFATVLQMVLFRVLPVFIQVIAVGVYLFIDFNWIFCVITVGVVILYVIFTFWTTEWRNKYRRVMNAKDNEFNQKATDALLNFTTVKHFNSEEHEENRYQQSLDEYRAAEIINYQSLSILNIGQAFIIQAGILAMLYLSAKQVYDKDQSVGDYVMLQQFMMTLWSPLNFLGTYYRMIKQSLVDVESMFNLWDQQTDIVDRPDAVELKISEGAIEFKDVHFRYTDRAQVLQGVSFRAEPGQKTAIVGPTGAGKSTISNLIYRFYNVQSGTITVDGQDISTVTKKSLRRCIGIVPQDCVLFNDTIGYNIGYGVYGHQPEGATEQQIHDAAEASSLTNFISSTEKGYDTPVGERGLRLSGGEKQRVAIARAILKRPNIMLFDEATSSLDTKTEAEIQIELDKAAEGCTSLTIAHRLSTIMNAHKILVLKDGIIWESGNHEELLELGGEYSTLWKLQEQHNELKQRLKETENALKGKKGRGIFVNSNPNLSINSGNISINSGNKI